MGCSQAMTYSTMAQGLVIDRFAEPIALLREAAATLDIAGNWMPGSVTTYNIMGVVQPLKSNESFYLPEGIMAEDVRNLWIKDYQNGASFQINSRDKIQYSGDIFTVKDFQYWKPGHFYKARIFIVRDTD